VHWVDLLIVGVVAWLTFRAFANGLIRELVTFVALIGGIVVAGAFYRDLSADTAFLIEDERTRNFASFVALFAGVVVLGQLLAILLRQTASLLMLGPLDRLGGAAFGLLKALVLVQVVLLAVAVFPPSTGLASAVDDSTLAPLFLENAPGVLIALPPEFEGALDQLARFRAAAAAVAGGIGP
jgi:membrane protein required for colicin V production